MKRIKDKSGTAMRRHLLAAACSGAVASLIGAPVARAAEIIYDLRLANTGGKSATITTAAPTVNLDLFALIADPNGIADDTGFNSAQGAWTSSTGGMLGNFTTLLQSQFSSNNASQNPAPVDIDGDGDLDVGANTTAESGFWIASNGSNGYFVSSGSEVINGIAYRLFKLGTGTFTATGFASTSTNLNFIPRTGNALVKPHKYLRDSTSTLTSINGSDARLAVGSAVSLNLTGSSYSWIRAGNTNSWADPGNWDPGVVPNSALDEVVFSLNAAGFGTIPLNGDKSIGTIVFNDTTTPSEPFNIVSGSTTSRLLMNGPSGGTIRKSNSGNATISVGINSTDLVLEVNDTGLLNINGVINSSTLRKTGTGVATLGGSGSNVISGTTVVEAGLLQLNRSGRAIGDLVVEQNAAVVWLSPNQMSGSTATLLGGTLNLNNRGGSLGGIILGGQGGGPGAVLQTGTGMLTLLGNVTFDATSGAAPAVISGFLNLGATRTFNVGDAFDEDDLSVTANVVGQPSAGIVKTGTGTLLLSGENTYDGPTSIAAGRIRAMGGFAIGDSSAVSLGSQPSSRLEIEANETIGSLAGGAAESEVAIGGNTLTVGGDGSSTTFSGRITGAGGSLIKTGSGTFSMAGTFANTVSGVTTVNGGILRLAKTAGLNAVAGDVVVNTGGTLRWGASNQIPDTATLTLNSGGTIDLSGFTETVGSFIDNGGSTILAGGNLFVASGGDIVLNDGTNIASSVSLGGNLQYIGTSTTATISGNIGLAPTPANHDFIINNGAAAVDVEISGGISGSTSITKTGAGTLLFSGSETNTNNGLTTVSAGTLALNKTPGAGIRAIAGPLNITGGTVRLLDNDQIADTSAVTIAPGGVLDMNARSDAIGTLSGAGAVQTGGGVLTVLGSGSTDFSGVISGSGTFRYLGNGTLTLAGANTISNLIAIGGTVSVASSSNLGTASILLSGGTLRATTSFTAGNAIMKAPDVDGTIDVLAGGNLTLTNALSAANDTGTLIKTGGGDLTLSGSGTYSGPIRVDAGSLVMMGNRDFSSMQPLTVAAGATVNLSDKNGLASIGTLWGAGAVALGDGLVTGRSGVTSTFAGPLSGADASLSVANNGTLILTGASSIDRANSIGGTLRVDSGTLELSGALTVDASGSVPAASVVIANAGTLNAAEGFVFAAAGKSAGLSVEGAGSNLDIFYNLNIGANASGQMPGAATMSITSGAQAEVGLILKVWQQGVLTLDGGTLSVGELDTESTPSRFNWISGRLEIGGPLAVSTAGPLGSAVAVNGDKTLLTRNLTVGSATPATLTISGGGVVNSASDELEVTIGDASGGEGTVTVSGTGSSWTVGPINEFRIGNAGRGTVNVQSGGEVIASGDVVLAGVASSPSGSALNVDGVGSRFTTTESMYVGGSASAAGGAATVAVTDGGVLSVTGTLKTWQAGALTVTDAAIDAGTLALSGEATVNGGGSLNVGEGGLISSGGQINLGAHSTTPGTLALGGDVTYNASGSTLQIAAGPALPGQLAGTVNLLGQTRTFYVGDGAQNSDVMVSARLVNGALVKTGDGTLALLGSNDYTGGTTINDGVVFAGAGALPAASAVTVNNSGILRLGGNATIASLASSSVQPGSAQLQSFSLTVGDETSSEFYGAINGGQLIKQGSGTFTVSGDINGSDITVNRGVLRLRGDNPLLSGDIRVNGTGPTWGTLATTGANLGTATLTLDGGRLLVEGTSTRTRDIQIEFGGGTFEIAAGNVFTQSGVVTGAGGIAKEGAGTLVLNSASNYDGQTFIGNGVLGVGTANAIPAASELLMADSGKLNLNNNSQTVASIMGDGEISLGSATLTVGGNDATTQFTGEINGTGKLVKNGAGTFSLTGPLSFTVGIEINKGTLLLDGSNSIAGGIDVKSGAAVSVDSAGHLGGAANQVTLDGGSFQANGSFVSSNPISVSAVGGTIDVAGNYQLSQAGALTGSGTLTKQGTGTLQLETASAFGGVVAIDNGALELAAGGAMQSASSFRVQAGATLTLDNSTANLASRVGDAAGITLAGGTLELIGAAGVTSSESAGALTLEAGSSSINLQQGGASGSGTELSFSSLTVSNGATLDVAIPAAGLTNRLMIAGQAEGFLGGWATIDESDFAKYVAQDGVVPLSSSQYSSTLSADQHVRLSASGSTAGSLNIKTLTLNASTPLEVTVAPAETLTISSGGLIKTGPADAEITGGAVASDSGRLDVRVKTGTLVIDSNLTGAMHLSKNGGGVLELSGDSAGHNFSGNIYLGGGTLRIAKDANLGQGVGAGNDLFFNGGTLATTGEVTFGAGRTLNFNGAGGTLDVGDDAVIGSANQIAGSGMLSKSGSGLLRITNANAYTGPVTVKQGAVQLEHVNALGSATMFAPGQERSTITLDPGTSLHLRHDDDPANFGNDIVVTDNTPATSATITTGPRTGNTAGQFILGGLKIGDATLATGGSSGSLTFSGIVTTTGVAKIDAGRNVLFADRVTGGGSLTKLGEGTLRLGSHDPANNIFDTAANTYAGITNIAGGVLELNKAAGTVAIPGNIALSGGTLVLLQPRQIGDNSAVVLSGGTFDLAGQDDAIKTLENSGARMFVTNATLTVGSSIITGGETLVGGTGGRGGPARRGLEATATASSRYITDSMSMSSGIFTVARDSSLEIGSGGLTFTGSASPTITLASDSEKPGRLIIAGEVTNSSTSGTPTIATASGTPIVGSIELASAVRTFTVPSLASDLRVTGRLTQGGLRKSGGGVLRLEAAGDYTLGTTIADGTIEARDGALGTGPITLSGGNLNLRSDAVTGVFGNDVVASDAVVNIGRVSGGGSTGTMQLGRLSIGSSRLRFTGSSGGGVEFTGPTAISGTQSDPSFIDNAVAVTFKDAISGSGAYLTKDGGAGTLSFSGNAANTFSGVMRVNFGTLELNKPARVNAVAGNLDAFTGGQVLWKNAEQVADTATLTVNGSASKMNLAGHDETVAAISMNAGTIETGAGILKVNGNITTAASTAMAKITGKLSLGDITRTVTVGNGPPTTDLEIQANITGGAGLIKAGAGALLLSGDNTLGGGITVQGGSVRTTGNTTLSGKPTLDLGSGSMTIDTTGGFSTALNTTVTKSGTGALTVRGSQAHAAGAKLVVSQGALNLFSDAGSTTQRNLNIEATGGSVAINSSQHLAGISVGNGVTATMAAGRNKVLYTDSLSTGSTGTLNIGDNFVVVTNGDAGTRVGSGYTGLSGDIARGLNEGTWDGPGIVTNVSGALDGRYTVGIIPVLEAFGEAGEFAGEDVPAQAVLIRTTYAGDANLDGQIDADDYSIIDFNYRSTQPRAYWRGDFNYDGAIDADDYSTIDVNLRRQIGQLEFIAARPASAGAADVLLEDLLSVDASAGAGLTAVPEPASLTAVGIFASMLLRRRRRLA